MRPRRGRLHPPQVVALRGGAAPGRGRRHSGRLRDLHRAGRILRRRRARTRPRRGGPRPPVPLGRPGGYGHLRLLRAGQQHGQRPRSDTVDCPRSNRRPGPPAQRRLPGGAPIPPRALRRSHVGEQRSSRVDERLLLRASLYPRPADHRANRAQREQRPISHGGAGGRRHRRPRLRAQRDRGAHLPGPRSEPK